MSLRFNNYQYFFILVIGVGLIEWESYGTYQQIFQK